MKRDMNLLADQLRSKLTAKCVTAVLTEAFINGLPLKKSEVKKYSADFANYSNSVISTMHPETMATEALKTLDPKSPRYTYVEEFQKNISAVVESAVARICKEASEDLLSTTPELVENAKLEKEEVERLVKAAQSSNTTAVADLVKKKVINCLKDEKEAYENSEKIKEEIKEVLTDKPDEDEATDEPTDVGAPEGIEDETATDQPSDETSEPETTDTEETPSEETKEEETKEDEPKEEEPEETEEEKQAVESFMSMVLKPTDVRSHVSFVSRLTDVCMEALYHSKEEYEGFLPFETLTKVTLESTLPMFDISKRTLEDELDSMLLATEAMEHDHEHGEDDAEHRAHKTKKIAKTAFICSIAILTLLETLKTMNLRSPKPEDVRDFVDKGRDFKGVGNTDLADLKAKAVDAADTVKKTAALGAMGALECADGIAKLDTILNKLEELPVAEKDAAAKEEIMNILSAAKDVASTPVTPDEPLPITDSFTERKQEENIVQMDRGVKQAVRNPQVTKIQIRTEGQEPTKDKDVIAAEALGLNKAGQIVTQFSMTLHACESFGKTSGELVSNLTKYTEFGGKYGEIYFTDTCYAVPVKN